MASLNDFGRQIDEARDHPQPGPHNRELDDLERRLAEFFRWAHQRERDEVAQRFHHEFAGGSGDKLSGEHLDALVEGRGAEVRADLPIDAAAADDPSRGS